MNDLRSAVLGQCQPRVTRGGSGVTPAVQPLRAPSALAGTFVPFPALKTGDSHRGPIGCEDVSSEPDRAALCFVVQSGVPGVRDRR